MTRDLESAPDLSRPQSFQIKGALLPLTLLEIKHNNLDLIQKELSVKVRTSPDFFYQNPVVFGLERMELCAELKLNQLFDLCVDCGLIPVGIKGGTEAQRLEAANLKIAVFPAGRASARKAHDLAKQKEQPALANIAQELSTIDEAIEQEAIKKESIKQEARKQESTKQETAKQTTMAPGTTSDGVETAESIGVEKIGVENLADNQPVPPERGEQRGAVAPLIIDTPVRSGQQVYHKGDIIVLTSVSHGAELLSEGNIHVYGALRGRALAGVLGNEKARIFCSSQEAELVSIAGHFVIDEHLKQSHWKESVHVFYNGKGLTIKALSEQ